jgi:hypothetical protein
MAFYRTREGALTAADSFTALGSLFGQSTTAAIQIPQQASQIVPPHLLCNYLAMVYHKDKKQWLLEVKE